LAISGCVIDNADKALTTRGIVKDHRVGNEPDAVRIDVEFDFHFAARHPAAADFGNGGA